MPEMNGIELATILKDKYPKTRVLMLTSSNSQKNIDCLLELGVDGYVLKASNKSTTILNISK